MKLTVAPAWVVGGVSWGFFEMCWARRGLGWREGMEGLLNCLPTTGEM